MNFFKRLPSGKRGFWIKLFWNILIEIQTINFIIDASILFDIVRFIGVHIIPMKHTVAARKCLMKNHSLPVLGPVILPKQFYLNASHFHSATLKSGWMLKQVNRQVVSNEIYPRNNTWVKKQIMILREIKSTFFRIRSSICIQRNRSNWPKWCLLYN